MHAYYISAQTITEHPVNVTVPLSRNATFHCRGTSNITWVIATTQIRHTYQVFSYATQHKMYIPLPKANFSELIITATMNNNRTEIYCIVGPSNVISGEGRKSETAYLLSYGKCTTNNVYNIITQTMDGFNDSNSYISMYTK